MNRFSLLLSITCLLACGSDDVSVTDAQIDATTDAKLDVSPNRRPDAGQDAAVASYRIGASLVLVTPSYVAAQFSSKDGPGSCLAESKWGCDVRTCDTERWSPASAGDITVSTASSTATLMFDPVSMQYPSPTLDWEPGDAITIAANGDEVPAFEVTVMGPEAVAEITEPDFPSEVAIDKPLEVAWAGDAEQVSVRLQCRDGSKLALCPLDDGDNRGTVPPEVLAELAAACDGADFILAAEDRQIIHASEAWPIAVSVFGSESYEFVDFQK